MLRIIINDYLFIYSHVCLVCYKIAVRSQIPTPESLKLKTKRRKNERKNKSSTCFCDLQFNSSVPKVLMEKRRLKEGRMRERGGSVDARIQQDSNPRFPDALV